VDVSNHGHLVAGLAVLSMLVGLGLMQLCSADASCITFTAFVPTYLAYVDEPTHTKQSLNDAAPDVKEAALRQASDIAAPVYRIWKDQLHGAGLTWQAFQSAASANRDNWRSWLNGELAWRVALERLVERLNGEHGSSLVLGE
jgi:hypothetical protein